jgi:ACS family tartrate transporter-like MFS transporter
MTTVNGIEAGAEIVGVRTIQKLRFRILPYLLLLYVIAYLDRINIGFAALTMNKELAIQPAVRNAGWSFLFRQFPL